MDTLRVGLRIGAMVGVLSAGPVMAQVVVTPSADGVAVDIDGKPFTVFHAGGKDLNRVYLHPLRAATGTVVNRSVPPGQLPGETKDHPHHAGLFYGHGDVNGFNFWAIRNEPPGNADVPASTLGRIVLSGPVETTSGPATGTIAARLQWLQPDGTPLLVETRTMTFHAHPTLRIIDVDITLRALARAEFRDTKEGTFAMRMATELDEPPATAKPGAPRRTGRLLNSRGGVGEKQVWGKQAEWVDYAGQIGTEAVGVVMMDHPGNPRHPTYWHSRGYGLHSINPFGLHDFLNDKTRNGGMTIDAGQEVRFRYRVVIHPGLSAAALADLYRDYAQGRAPSR